MANILLQSYNLAVCLYHQNDYSSNMMFHQMSIYTFWFFLYFYLHIFELIQQGEEAGRIISLLTTSATLTIGKTFFFFTYYKLKKYLIHFALIHSSLVSKH